MAVAVAVAVHFCLRPRSSVDVACATLCGLPCTLRLTPHPSHLPSSTVSRRSRSRMTLGTVLRACSFRHITTAWSRAS